MDLDELLGIDPDDPLERNAAAQVAADDQMLTELVRLREARGLTQEAVGRSMGTAQSAVARIESGNRDPRLSTLRRYALAVSAVVQHSVHEAEDPG